MNIYVHPITIWAIVILFALFIFTLIVELCVRASRAQWIIYSCEHIHQTYIKPVTVYEWLGKEYPAVCKECGTGYTYKYLRLGLKYPKRYYRLPGFKRIVPDDDE